MLAPVVTRESGKWRMFHLALWNCSNMGSSRQNYHLTSQNHARSTRQRFKTQSRVATRLISGVLWIGDFTRFTTSILAQTLPNFLVLL